MKMRKALTATLAGLITLLAPLHAHAWWNKDWNTRAKVTLNTTAQGVATQEAVSGLAIPVRLHSGNFDFAGGKEDGSDLRVVGADDKTPLPFVLERYDAVNELAVLWVQVPNVLPGSDKNVVYVYGGNAKAAAEAPGKVFEGNYQLAVHFAEKDGAAQDAAGGVKSDAAVARERNGLLGGSARLSGTAINWPTGGKLKADAGGSATVALWVKPESADGTLVQWGGLRLALAGGQLGAELGKTKVAAGNLVTGTWQHVAITVGAGKLTVYVNGAKVGEGDGALAATDGAISVGQGYTGLVDELTVQSSPLSADAVKVLAGSQGANGRLVVSVKEGAGDAAEGGEPGYFGILLKNLTTDAWVVIIILLVMFAIAAWVMVSKAMHVAGADRDNEGFKKRFREATTDLLTLDQGDAYAKSPIFRLYMAGLRELRKRDVGAAGVTLSGASLDAVKASIDADLVRESHRLNAKMVLLTIAISGGPFLGLLGTVVGVMITFAAIAAAGDVNVNAIAPGIAAALLATVAGLGVAIPALFGYNYLAARIKNISADMQIFVDEFVTTVAERYGQR